MSSGSPTPVIYVLSIFQEVGDSRYDWLSSGPSYSCIISYLYFRRLVTLGMVGYPPVPPTPVLYMLSIFQEVGDSRYGWLSAGPSYSCIIYVIYISGGW